MKIKSATGLTWRIGIATSLVLAAFQNAPAAVSYSTIGSTYFQDFDSLPNTPTDVSLGNTSGGFGWIDDSAAPGVNKFSIVGWYLYHPTVQTEGGANGHQRVRIGAGAGNTGAFMSYGAAASTDRALGDLGSAATQATSGGSIWYGVRLSNDTGVTLDSFTVTYDGEQWRDGGAAVPNAQTMNFMYSTTATAMSDPNTSFTSVAALNFTSPVFVNTGLGAAVDGNIAGKVAGITATVTGITWAPGVSLWLRWDNVNQTGNDHGMAVDNFNFSATAVPEPSTCVFAGLGAAALLVFRRRR